MEVAWQKVATVIEIYSDPRNTRNTIRRITWREDKRVFATAILILYRTVNDVRQAPERPNKSMLKNSNEHKFSRNEKGGVVSR